MIYNVFRSGTDDLAQIGTGFVSGNATATRSWRVTSNTPYSFFVNTAVATSVTIQVSFAFYDNLLANSLLPNPATDADWYDLADPTAGATQLAVPPSQIVAVTGRSVFDDSNLVISGSTDAVRRLMIVPNGASFMRTRVMRTGALTSLDIRLMAHAQAQSQ